VRPGAALAPASEPEQEEALYRRVSWRLLPVLIGGYLLAYLDRVNVGFAKLQMLADLQFTETVYGLGAGIFFLGYFLFEVPSNLILHRVGARRWIARIMISWGLLSAAMPLVRSEPAFYVLRFLLGAAEAGFFPGIILYLTDWYPARRRAQITAAFMTAIALSGVIGGPVSGAILEGLSGRWGWAGWQWLFLVEGLPSVLYGLWIYLRLDDRIESARWLGPEEKRLLLRRIADEQPGRVAHRAWEGLRDPAVWRFGLIYFCLVAPLYGVGFWLPSLVKSLGSASLFQVGLLSAVPYLAAAVCMVLAGRHADRSGERYWHVALPALTGATGLALSVIGSAAPVAAMAALTLGCAGILTALPLFWSLPTAYLGDRAAAAGLALINSLGNLAGFLAPYLMGWTVQHSGSTRDGMHLLALVLAAGALLVLRARRTAGARAGRD
jgi:MFS family permease